MVPSSSFSSWCLTVGYCFFLHSFLNLYKQISAHKCRSVGKGPDSGFGRFLVSICSRFVDQVVLANHVLSGSNGGGTHWLLFDIDF